MIRLARIPGLTTVAIRHPRVVVAVTLVITLLFAAQLPKIRTDTDPKNMLPATSDVRVYNDRMEEWFALHKDVLVLGIVNERGIFNPESLRRLERITRAILQIPGVVVRDVASLTTVDDVAVEAGGLVVRPAVADVPEAPAGLETLQQRLVSNPLIVDRLVSRDGTTTAVFIPLEGGANAKVIADRIKAILADERGGSDRFYLAGDPVARDTFGAQMFYQMAVFSPLAALVMMLALYIMFRNAVLVALMMSVATVSIVWSLGLLIGLGFPVHIMSSMMPVFLMAIATDSVHIFNEFYFRAREVRDRRAAVTDTLAAVGRPVRYTALATAAGFAVLTFMHIIPVRVFGAFVAFGTVVLRLLSFSLIPAVLMLIPESRILSVAASEDTETDRVARFLGRLGAWSVSHRAAVLLFGFVLLGAALIGITRINVNNNMVSWFRPGSEIRQADRVMNARLGGTAQLYLVMETDSADALKNPHALLAVEGLQREVEKLPSVGKTVSVVDVVKRINRVLHGNDPAREVVPDSPGEIAQYLLLFSMAAKPQDLDNFIDYDAQKANVFVNLRTWDAQAVRDVLSTVAAYRTLHLTATPTVKPAGVAYFNLVWNEEVLWDMIRGFGIALAVVFVILAVNFRSVKWAVVGYTPLLVTVVLVYGVIGWMRKDFDMPISVLSTLSLGMAVDFAIHFVGRFRGRYESEPNLERAVIWTAARPGKGILRNAMLFAAAFSVMLFASLTPYVTVGAFIAGMMLLSAAMTIIYLPALVSLFRRGLGCAADQGETR